MGCLTAVRLLTFCMTGARSEGKVAPFAPFGEHAGRLGLTLGQAIVVGAMAMTLGLALRASTAVTLTNIVFWAQVGFLVCAAWRIALIFAMQRGGPTTAADPEIWPRYTVLVALHDEASIMDQIVDRLSRIDYPADRLEGFLLLERDDAETIAGAQRVVRPDWLEVVIVPPGEPQTKPRALNHGLARATGELVTVYDAEDDPDPQQLKEAASRFASAPDPRLACLQSPLRIRRRDRSARGSAFLDRQFAVEYAALFEVTLPGLARLGLPFPLGGTSNHFRADALKAVGGWDAYNVTEDADLGFRLWRAGLRQGMLNSPTWETPPGDLAHWLPQRTRWMKGFMQTWGVHTRRPAGLGWRGGAAMIMTVGAAVASAAVHALSLAWVAATVLVAVVSDLPPATPVFAIGVLLIGAASAWLTCKIGARRAGVPYTAADMIAAPAYWSLLTLAFVHAVWRLIREPHAWDKTPHRPDMEPAAPVDAIAAGRQAA